MGSKEEEWQQMTRSCHPKNLSQWVEVLATYLDHFSSSKFFHIEYSFIVEHSQYSTSSHASWAHKEELQ